MRAQLTTTALSVGAHTLTAEYSGNGTFGPSTSAPVAQTVYQGTAPTSTTTSVTSSPNPSAYGQTVTFTASVTARRTQPAGFVQFFADGIALGSPIATDGSGSASIGVSSLSVGFHTITAQYLGNGTFAGSTGQTVQFVQ